MSPSGGVSPPGDWRGSGGSTGVTGVFLDPPYSPEQIAIGASGDGFARSDRLYSHHEAEISAEVRRWAIEHGDDPRLRIALCGYDGEHEMPPSWTVVAWTSQGGYSNRGANPRCNAGRERIWFSPHCLGRSMRGPLFAEARP